MALTRSHLIQVGKQLHRFTPIPNFPLNKPIRNDAKNTMFDDFKTQLFPVDEDEVETKEAMQRSARKVKLQTVDTGVTQSVPEPVQAPQAQQVPQVPQPSTQRYTSMPPQLPTQSNVPASMQYSNTGLNMSAAQVETPEWKDVAMVKPPMYERVHEPNPYSELYDKHPFRKLIDGVTGSGKGVILNHMMNKSFGNYFPFIYWFSPTFRSDPTFKKRNWEPTQVFEEWNADAFFEIMHEAHVHADKFNSDNLQEEGENMYVPAVPKDKKVTLQHQALNNLTTMGRYPRMKLQERMKRYFADPASHPIIQNQVTGLRSKLSIKEQNIYKRKEKRNGNTSNKRRRNAFRNSSSSVGNDDEDDKKEEKSLLHVKPDGGPVLIVIDDFASDTDAMQDPMIIEAAFGARHKNVSIIIFTQAYKRVNNNYRESISSGHFFRPTNADEADKIAQEQACSLISKIEFRRIHTAVTMKKKHNFLTVMHNAEDATRMYREGFGKVIPIPFKHQDGRPWVRGNRLSKAALEESLDYQTETIVLNDTSKNNKVHSL